MSKPKCLAPFLAVNASAYGLSPCCHLASLSQAQTIDEYFADPKVVELQSLHCADDISALPKLCQICISDASNTSFNLFGYGNREDFTQTYEQGGGGLTFLLFSSDFTCGYSCAMCVTSDKKYKEWDKIGRDIYTDVKMPLERIRNDFDVFGALKANINTMKLVTFAGGDPALNPETAKVLAFLSDYPDIEVIYHHNGQMNTLTDGSNLWERLKVFKKLTVFFSSDGTDDINTSLRIGFKAKRFQRMVEEAVTYLPHAEFGILMSITTSNILRIDECLKHFESTYLHRGFMLALSPVFYPEWHSPGVIPNKLRLVAMKALRNYEGERGNYYIEKIIQDILGVLQTQRHDLTMWNLYMTERQRLDALYGTDILQLNPEFKPYWVIG